MPKYVVMFYRFYEMEEDSSDEAVEEARKPFENDLVGIMDTGGVMESVVDDFSAIVVEEQVFKKFEKGGL